MKREFYQRLHDKIASDAEMTRMVTRGSEWIPLLIYAFYPLFLIYIALFAREQLLYAIMVPLAGFLVCTVLRSLINAPRPYEAMQIPAIVPKNTRGKSFPSRHAASAAVIAVTVIPLLPVPGVIVLAVSLLIVLIRVLAGVHFIRDVVCGWLLGAVIGVIGAMLFL